MQLVHEIANILESEWITKDYFFLTLAVNAWKKGEKFVYIYNLFKPGLEVTVDIKHLLPARLYIG